MAEREVPRATNRDLLHQVDQDFVQEEHIVSLLMLTHSVTGRTQSSY